MSNLFGSFENGMIRDSSPEKSYTVPATTSNSYFILKRCIDLLICTFALVFTLPLMLLIALLIRIDTPGPILFSQTRVGAKTKSVDRQFLVTLHRFRMYKFRTMHHKASDRRHREFIRAYIFNDKASMANLQKGAVTESSQYKLVGDPRVTPVGRWLRKSSLDELPQIINVILGNMSLVGPRPAIPYELEMYEPWHRKRLLSQPGITGLWQVTARSSISFEEMVELDIEYIKERSIKLDLLILFKTPLVVLKGEGAQ